MPNDFSPEQAGATTPHPIMAAPAVVFPYVYRWDRHGRKGQFCRQINRTGQYACIEFQDGTRLVSPVSGIIRRKGFENSIKVSNSVKEGGRGESPEPLGLDGIINRANTDAIPSSPVSTSVIESGSVIR